MRRSSRGANEGGIQDGLGGFANPVTVEINFRPVAAMEEEGI